MFKSVHLHTLNVRGAVSKAKRQNIDSLLSSLLSPSSIIFLSETNNARIQHPPTHVSVTTLSTTLLIPQHLYSLQHTTATTRTITTFCPTLNILVVGIYGPPQTRDRAAFWGQTTFEVQAAITSRPGATVVVFGDFNLQHTDRLFLHAKAAWGLDRVPTPPTFISSRGTLSTIDHILHRGLRHTSVHTQEIEWSDHRLLSLQFKTASLNAPPAARLPRRVGPELLQCVQREDAQSLAEIIDSSIIAWKQMSRSLRDLRYMLAATPVRSQDVEDYATELQHILYKTLFPRSTADPVQTPPPPPPPVQVHPPGDDTVMQQLLSFIDNGLPARHISVSIEDIEFARQRMHPTSAAGPDGIEPALLHSLKDELLRWEPETILQDALSYNTGRQVRVVQVPKPGGGTRPIAVINAVKRFASAIVTSALTRALPKRAFQFQEGFVTGGSPWRHILAVDSIRLTHPNKSVLFLDFAGAYDSIRRSYLKRVLHAWDEHTLVGLVDTILTGLAPEGVPQGLPLSPLLFILALHPVLQLIQQRAPNLNIYAYADDIALVGNTDELQCALQSINQVSNCSRYTNSGNPIY